MVSVRALAHLSLRHDGASLQVSFRLPLIIVERARYKCELGTYKTVKARR